ncbi:MAG: GNAT family N-acetyltransferase [Chloroflexi bacterium]|nr:GNAT family N-acetyltransferase [Chloroflexota bacterium]
MSLQPILNPRTIAVIGATEREGSIGRTVMWNLITNGFEGVIYPINIRRRSVMGIRAYSKLADVPDEIDLAIIMLRADKVVEAVRDCVAAGVRGAIITSAGFREMGEAGAEREAAVLSAARAGGLRLIGPNSLGVMVPRLGLNATFARGIVQPGRVGFLTQSGALGTAVLDWSLRENVGFSAVISVGSMVDVDWGDLLNELGNDPHTRSIIVYMETIGRARAFLSSARAVAMSKPIIVLKPGRTAEAARAAVSHTGSLTGQDEVLEAAFRRCGVLRVNTLDELFYMAESLDKQPRPIGPRLAIVTNAGGPAVLATDELILGGGQLAPLSEETMAALNAILPAHWSHNNPLDVLGDATPEQFAQTLEIVAKDKTAEGLLAILTPQGMTDATAVAKAILPLARSTGKPVLASWMGGGEMAEGERLLNQAGIPTFAYPDAAARVFNYMWRYSRNLRSLYETPSLPEDSDNELTAHAYATAVIEEVRLAGRTLLTEYETKMVLAAYHIPTLDTRLEFTAEEAAATADQIGYPVVLKVNSHHITHKLAAGGIELPVGDKAAVRQAFGRIQAAIPPEHFDGVTVQPYVPTHLGLELLLGSSQDGQCGPVLLFGMGGTAAEIVRDTSLSLPPLNSTLARRLMERTRIYEGLVQSGVDMAEMEQLLVRFSQLVVEQPWVKEVEINPLFASKERVGVLDGRIILHPPNTPPEKLSKPAIRPYPRQYSRPWRTKQGLDVTIRPIRPEDEPQIVAFHSTLSEQSVYLRYFQSLNMHQRTNHDRLTKICFIDYDREMALVAEHKDPATGELAIVAVGRLTRQPLDPSEAEFATIVADAYHGQGLGTVILERLIEIGRVEGLHKITAVTLPENLAMKRVFERLGFAFGREDGLTKVVLEL